MADKLITIARYRDFPPAGLDKSILEDHGIPCFLNDHFTVGTNWLYSNAIGGLKLKVREEHVDEAKEILKSIKTDYQVPIEDQQPIVDGCPSCGSEDTIIINYTNKFAAISLLIGIPLPFFAKRNKCNACGYRWK